MCIRDSISNIGLGYVLIVGVGGIGGFGIYGAAAALTMAQAIGAITGLVLLFKGPYKVFSAEQLKEKIFHYDWKCIKDVYSTGIPAAIENFFWQFSAIIMSRAILTLSLIHISPNRRENFPCGRCWWQGRVKSAAAEEILRGRAPSARPQQPDCRRRCRQSG